MSAPAADVAPRIDDYGLIGDGHTAALVSRHGSIDWCCLPRFDARSCFARLLDVERGGNFSITPRGEIVDVSRQYREGSMILETTFRTSEGTAKLTDLLAVDDDRSRNPRRRIVRIVEGLEGHVTFDLGLSARFDDAAVRPLVREFDDDSFGVVGGDQGLHVVADVPLCLDEHDLEATIEVKPGDHRRVVASFWRPEQFDPGPPEYLQPDAADDFLDATEKRWLDASPVDRDLPVALRRSANVLESLVYRPTGALIAAPTTSLPESMSGDRNWDYRFSWIRDSTWAGAVLGRIGVEDVAADFRRFVDRTAAGHADELQVLFGIGGERRVPEQVLDHLSGHRGVGSVRVGNAAAGQQQHDVYGELLLLAWHWYQREHAPSEEHWRFLGQAVETAARRWEEPDAGIWEWRGDPKNFVHSKAMCWVALDRGARLAESAGYDAPVERWRHVADDIHRTVMDRGVDSEHGGFVQAFGSSDCDAALLQLPMVGFVDHGDPVMVATADIVVARLVENDFVYRYRTDDSLAPEGAFLPCNFWLAEVLAHQGREDEARLYFDRACSAANDLGLFSEEVDPESEEPLGNFPQALTHFSHISAALAVDRDTEEPAASGHRASR